MGNFLFYIWLLQNIVYTVKKGERGRAGLVTEGMISCLVLGGGLALGGHESSAGGAAVLRQVFHVIAGCWGLSRAVEFYPG